MNDWEDHLTDDLAGVAEQLRTHRHEPSDLRLDELKRQAMAKATRASGRRQGRGFVRSKVVTMLLVFGLLLASGGAGVIANHQAGGDGSPPASAGHGQYCNSGNGNGYEEPQFPTTPTPGKEGTQTSADCDPGNSATHNMDNDREQQAGPSRFSP